MINRANWLDVKHFLKYQENTAQNENRTLNRYRTNLVHLLEWADSKPFHGARLIDPTFPSFLLSLRVDREGKSKPLAPATLSKILQTSRHFFMFARRTWPMRYKLVTEGWIETLQLPKRASMQSQLKDHSHYKLEDILKIASLPAENLRKKRDIAAACFLFLSGMRVDAFASLPISCVDLEEGKIYQLPEKGVRTKNSKAAVTYLLPIPELFAIVKEWDDLVRKNLSHSALWFPVMTRNGENFAITSVPHVKRGDVIGKVLRSLCERADIPYLSPHKLRHGHVVYALKNVKDMAGLKAVSQNVMHSSVTITDGIYGGLSGDDVQRVIQGLKADDPGKPAQGDETINQAAAALMEALKNNPDALQRLLGKA